MDAGLLDAAFGLVSHSLLSQQTRFHPIETEEERLDSLRRRFKDADSQAVVEALARARKLEETAIDMADQARNVNNDQASLSAESLAARCPGFSPESYFWAIEDGFVQTRK